MYDVNNSRNNLPSENEDFDFNEGNSNTLGDDQSVRSFDRRGGGAAPMNFANELAGYNNAVNDPRDANPLLGHHNLANNENIAREREDIDVRGQILKERLQNHEGDDQAADHLRIGGNYLNVKDPNKPPYSCFYLMVSGQIQSGTFDDQDGICCQFAIEGDKKDWQVHSVSSI